MGAIEEIYADIDADVPETKFRKAVEQKVDQMEGLADEETAAMIVAHEIADGEVDTVSDIEPAMDEVKFLAKVLAIGDPRTFERDDGEGRVINVEAADETGTVRLAFWDEQAAAVDRGELETGQVLRIRGRPKDGYNGLEVSVSDAEPDDTVEIDVSQGDEATIEALTLGQSDVVLQGRVLDTEGIRTFDRDDGSQGQVANLTLGDETGRVRVTLWDERAPRAEELAAGATVEVVDGYVRERDGEIELHVGDRGRIEAVSATVEYEPETTPIETVELDQTADIAGVVRSADPVTTFERDDGSEGQVRNIRLQDDSGDIRVALWGEKADLDIAPGDELLVADAEIQDGFRDDLEASAGWRSTVTVLEDTSTTAGEKGETDAGPTGQSGSTDDAVSNAGETGLDAFVDGESPGSATETGGEHTEFTGTVVQTGEPVVLDDGTETMPVETDARLRLGEEVTVRGRVDGERLDADEVL